MIGGKRLFGQMNAIFTLVTIEAESMSRGELMKKCTTIALCQHLNSPPYVLWCGDVSWMDRGGL